MSPSSQHRRPGPLSIDSSRGRGRRRRARRCRRMRFAGGRVRRQHHPASLSRPRHVVRSQPWRRLRHPPGEPPVDAPGALGVADGRLPDGVGVFDSYPAVTNLDPALLAALREAATDAAGDGVTFYVNSGWRSSAYQEQLRQRRSRSTAPARNRPLGRHPRHVASRSGNAVDVGDLDATTWLSEHGSRYGLCQIYATSHGTTNCVSTPSTVAARTCTPTRRTTQGCSSDSHVASA